MNIFKMRNTVQNYAWGTTDFIPYLLKKANNANKPQAELWMGAHPKAPSYLPQEGCTLLDLISKNPAEYLGKSITEQFDAKLPFLFKVLSAAAPLSIQAHPNLQQAEAGFQRENEAQIPLNAFQRNYKDANHKPELICALTPFTALCGFRDTKKIIQLLHSFRMQSVLPNYSQINENQESFKIFFSRLLNTKKQEISHCVAKLVNRARSKPGLISKWIIILNEFYPGDVGVLSPILLNLIELKPNEALYLPAGVLHAYLQGSGVEIMANSDNVLRGGLTPKHIDVPELLKTLSFSSGDIEKIEPKAAEFEAVYNTGAAEFELSRIILKDQDFFQTKSNGPEIILCYRGSGSVFCQQERIELEQGESIFISASCQAYSVQGEGTYYRAVIPAQRGSHES